MPWKPSDAKTHNSAVKSDKQSEAWAKVANDTLAAELKKGTEEKKAEGIAIATANKAVAGMKESVDRTTETLREFVDSRGAQLHVDRANGIIRGVKILGLVSKNGRTYDAGAVAKARPLYEGVKVNVNHAHGGPGGPRDYQDRMGSIRQVQLAADGLYGDFHFNPKHPLAEQLAWDAEHAPENVGFSHNVEARTTKRGGKVVVEEITCVTSVDLVADPATTRGLFEDEQVVIESDPVLKELAEHGFSAISDLRATLLAPELTIQARKQRLSEGLAAWQTELSGASEEPIQESTNMDLKDLTIDQLKEHRQDLVEQLTGTDATSKLRAELETVKGAGAKLQEELTAAKSQLATIEAEKAALAKTAAITEELKASKLDTSNKTVCSEVFMESLKAAPDAAARKRIIDDRVAAFRAVASSTAYASAAPLAPLTEAEVTAPPSTVQEFLSKTR